MRRADRLFQIIQILRRSSRPATAGQIAVELEVSQRTIYRDIADLIARRVPIQGEAGFGYIIDTSFDMPPLMLTSDEIEVAILGAQWVMGRGDPALARAALDLIAKITSVAPENLQPFITTPSIGTPPGRDRDTNGIDLTRTRAAIHDGRKIQITYRDEQGRTSRRTIWPVIIGFMENTCMLAAWCELREDFRHFRTDRILSAEFLTEDHGVRPSTLRQRWKRNMAQRLGHQS